MTWIVSNIKWLMLVSGALTCTMLYALIAPQPALQSNFGEGLEGPVAEIVVRNWGALIGLVGAMLIYGAFNPASRPMALMVAAVSKLTFITLVLVHGQQYLGEQAGIAIGVDAVWVLLFALYFVGSRNRPRARAAHQV
jgi:hypothetical protein